MRVWAITYYLLSLLYGLYKCRLKENTLVQHDLLKLSGHYRLLFCLQARYNNYLEALNDMI